MELENIHIFEQKKVRTMWDEEKQEWFFSIVDVCAVLTDQDDYDLAKNYWKVLKHRLIKEGNESVTKCNQLKLASPKDGKRYATDVADMALLLNALAEETATEISKERNPQGLTENARIAKEGADVAKAAREDVEKRLGRSVVSSQKAIDYIQSPEDLPFEKPDEQ